MEVFIDVKNGDKVVVSLSFCPSFSQSLFSVQFNNFLQIEHVLPS